MRQLLVLASVPLAIALTPVQAQNDPSAWLGEVAAAYASWGRIDDELRWAPWLCRLPQPSRARVSRAATGEHRRKVYFVYASDRQSYLDVTNDRRVPRRGLTVVKEAFHPQEVAAEDAVRAGFGDQYALPGGSQTVAGIEMPNLYRATTDGEGRTIGAGAAGGLYVLKYVGRRRGTDGGWVYGTIDPRGRVTSHGLVEQCIGCHRSAPHGRLFGLAVDPVLGVTMPPDVD